MQIFYVAMTFSVFLTAGLFHQEDYWNDSEVSQQVVAEQMSLWHRKTYDKCVADGCKSGSVDPDGYVSQVLVLGDGDGTGKFVSMYDESTRTLKTRLRNASAVIESVSTGSASSALIGNEPYQAAGLDQHMTAYSDQSDVLMLGSADAIELTPSDRLYPEPFSAGTVGPMIVSVLPKQFCSIGSAIAKCE